jgi:transcriptional regulator with XRE-family HTH domain
MPSTLNHELLAGMIKAKRGNKGLRITAEEIGSVSSATLSRVEQGKVPDVDTFIALCKWLDVPTDTFILKSDCDPQNVSNQERIVAHLRAERELDVNTINSLIRMIDLAYKAK